MSFETVSLDIIHKIVLQFKSTRDIINFMRTCKYIEDCVLTILHHLKNCNNFDMCFYCENFIVIKLKKPTFPRVRTKDETKKRVIHGLLTRKCNEIRRIIEVADRNICSLLHISTPIEKEPIIKDRCLIARNGESRDDGQWTAVHFRECSCVAHIDSNYVFLKYVRNVLTGFKLPIPKNNGQYQIRDISAILKHIKNLNWRKCQNCMNYLMYNNSEYVYWYCECVPNP